MLTPLATGAAAKPFKTHHNALDIDLFARIAPELYLKRLVVGGFEKVYELNRNFRNEGISSKHNPEFTMLEFYMAYADVNQMMDFAEKLLRSVVYVALGHRHVRYGEHEIDFSQPFTRMTMKEAIARAVLSEPAEFTEEGILELLNDPNGVHALHNYYENTEQWIEQFGVETALEVAIRNRGNLAKLDAMKTAQQIAEIFEAIVEKNLIQPTFITDFPKPISPLSKASPADPSIAERFEYFVGGLESGNGFSELNDPEEQYQRFKDQVGQRERGDEEAMVMDEDYIRALSYGMPPAAGIGLGIDRLVMLLANKQSIRDVIMFPHMRPEKRADDEG
jgi:lysyl-tRNA synthetase class 2